MKTRNLAVTPVKKYAQPKYPTQKAIGREPDLLRKLPSCWEKNAAVVAAVGMLGAMVLASCGTERQLHGTPPMAAATSEQKFTEIETDWGALMGTQAIEIETEQIYGEVRENTDGIFDLPKEITPIQNFLDTSYILPAPGGTGPYESMSEANAFAIITSVAETYGLNFEKIPPDLENAPFHGVRVKQKLYDAEKQVGVEYSSDYGFQTKNPYVSSEGITVGTFKIGGYADEYDVVWDTEHETNMQALLEEDLRNQVRDFLEWLQGQGII